MSMLELAGGLLMWTGQYSSRKLLRCCQETENYRTM